jgi:hypothetical protein
MGYKSEEMDQFVKDFFNCETSEMAPHVGSERKRIEETIQLKELLKLKEYKRATEKVFSSAQVISISNLFSQFLFTFRIYELI